MSFIFRRSFATAAKVPTPSKVVCIGRNYAAHIAELQNAAPQKPFFFLKPPSAIVHPGQGPVVIPKGVKVHYEVELALIMGQRLRDHAPDDLAGALSAIDSYAVAIDMTARNVQDEAKKKGLPWDIAKGFDTFLPLSHRVTKQSLGGPSADPHNLELFLSVNGQTRQDASTELMLFRIPRILSEISRVMTLEPGDLVLTGTPAGVGAIKAGDVLRAGLRVGGHEVREGAIEIEAADATGAYSFSET